MSVSSALHGFDTIGRGVRHICHCRWNRPLSVHLHFAPIRYLAASPRRHILRRLVPLSAQRRTVFSASLQPLTPTEYAQAKLLETADVKLEAYRHALRQDIIAMDVEEQKARARVLRELGPLAEVWESYRNLRKAILDAQPHLDDPDPTLRDMFHAETTLLRSKLDSLLTDLLPRLLLPPIPTDHLPTLMSFNAGAGGTEAALFCEELVRMYTRFAERKRWKIEVLSRAEGSPSKAGGGIREATIRFEPGPGSSYGEGGQEEVYGLMKWERGVHRVQRIPETEKEGRIHSSTAAVVVLPVYPETPDEPLADPKDVKQEVMRSRGAGGQHVNRTESAVRLTHIPTGITVSMQDSRSQHQNRGWAWEVLRARLAERKHNEEVEKRRATRQSQVKGLNRSDKIRTFNFSQDRLTDHRIGLSLNGLQAILEGDDLELVIDALKRDLDQRRLESLLLGEEDVDY